MTRRIYLASPYRGDCEANKLYARRCQADSLGRGEAPFVPHLLYTQSLDDDIADERELGMRAAMAWLPVCDALVLYTDRGVSDGMEVEAQQARRLGIPVEERACPGYARVGAATGSEDAYLSAAGRPQIPALEDLGISAPALWDVEVDGVELGERWSKAFIAAWAKAAEQ